MAGRRTAPVPSLGDDGPLYGKDAEFAQLNKQLRACHVCKLIKTGPQFLDTGCENCRWMEHDQETLHIFTTPNFSGLMTVMDTEKSWVAKWTHTSKGVSGCYALSINDDMPQRLQEMLENRGLRVPR